eukprot:14054322-Alexandrium_andersonii.AAC.1
MGTGSAGALRDGGGSRMGTGRGISSPPLAPGRRPSMWCGSCATAYRRTGPSDRLLTAWLHRA